MLRSPEDTVSGVKNDVLTMLCVKFNRLMIKDYGYFRSRVLGDNLITNLPSMFMLAQFFLSFRFYSVSIYILRQRIFQPALRVQN